MDRQGGLGVWSPSVTPGIGVELTDEQALACSFRILARDGFAENLAGHITWQRPGQEDLLVNPWGLWWAEVKGGATVAEATYRAASIDRVCRLAYDVLVTGRQPLPIAEGVMKGMKASVINLHIGSSGASPTTSDDASSFSQLDRIGHDHVLLESYYPHCDSTWPNTQRVIDHEIGHLPADDIRRITWQNAAELDRRPVPQAVQDDPNAY